MCVFFPPSLPAKPVGLCVARAFHSTHLHDSVEPATSSSGQSGSGTLNSLHHRCHWRCQVNPGCRLGRFKKTVMFPASLLTFNVLLQERNHIIHRTQVMFMFVRGQYVNLVDYLFHRNHKMSGQEGRDFINAGLCTTNSYKLQGFFFMTTVIVELNTLCFRKSLLRDKATEGCRVLVAFKRQGQILGASPWQRLPFVTLCRSLKCCCVKTWASFNKS